MLRLNTYRRAVGFTLVELLVVIGIIAVSLIPAAYGMISARLRRVAIEPDATIE